ncbi:hypothetical protein ACIQXF_22255 [Lysinibacillus sp. NPDC097231]|uniref:hypothetical protein n=1 Tax=Lysinibacillus sp. NPDC097231 TaxID=3364142 RepID=UPI0038081229
MSTSEQVKPKRNLKPLWIGLAFTSLIVITFLHNNDDLPIADHFPRIPSHFPGLPDHFSGMLLGLRY